MRAHISKGHAPSVSFLKVHERSECTFDYKNERSEFL
jgi:hypothetical protein